MLELFLETLMERCGVSEVSDIPQDVLKEEILETQETISNEHLWEMGAQGEDAKLHRENIRILMEYLEVLEDLLSSETREER